MKQEEIKMLTSISKGAKNNLIIPTIMEEDKGHIISSDILSRLLKDRIILFTGEVTQESSALAIAQLLYLESQDHTKPINMYIQSPGGSVDAGMAIFDTMQYIQSPVQTIACGMAASMGSILLCGGEPGMRCALPHANILTHQPLGGAEGQQTEIQIVAKHMQETRERLEGILMEHSNGKLTQSNIRDYTERDTYLTPQQALDAGIIDKIITR